MRSEEKVGSSVFVFDITDATTTVNRAAYEIQEVGVSKTDAKVKRLQSQTRRRASTTLPHHDDDQIRLNGTVMHHCKLLSNL